ncbi:hypothetical protein GCM10027072_76100 [Streptomyces bullii]
MAAACERGNARHRDVLAAELKERARIRSEKASAGADGLSQLQLNNPVGVGDLGNVNGDCQGSAGNSRAPSASSTAGPTVDVRAGRA